MNLVQKCLEKREMCKNKRSYGHALFKDHAVRSHSAYLSTLNDKIFTSQTRLLRIGSKLYKSSSKSKCIVNVYDETIRLIDANF